MVYEKKRSGDPDYDDKVPMDQQVGKIVTAGDGREVILSESNGPVDRVTGQHVNLDDPTGAEGDNRPAPGDVATESSTVQTYTAEDVPGGGQDAPKVSSQADAEKLAERESNTADKPTPSSARPAAGKSAK